MTNSLPYPAPLGIATVANELTAARDFYTRIYPYEVAESEFAGIPFFSILKDGIALVSVFQRTPNNPIAGTVPVLKVDHVGETLAGFESLGARVLIGESLCPCTQTNFALCADREGNQFIVKEAVPRH